MDKTPIPESKKTIIIDGIEYDTYDALTKTKEIIPSYFATSGKVVL